MPGPAPLRSGRMGADRVAVAPGWKEGEPPRSHQRRGCGRPGHGQGCRRGSDPNPPRPDRRRRAPGKEPRPSASSGAHKAVGVGLIVEAQAVVHKLGDASVHEVVVHVAAMAMRVQDSHVHEAPELV